MMSSVFARGRKLYAKIRDIDGEWRQVKTGFSVGDEEKARKWAADRDREIERMRSAKGGAAGPLTVSLYAEDWLTRRKTATVNDDRTRIEKHALPRIGHLPITDVRPRHLRDLMLELKAAGTISPKTIREVSGVLHNMFNSAEIEEIITSNPVKYERGVLPQKVDKDPTWRAQAIFTRSEVEQLISDERITLNRRVLYALKFFTGRHGEVSRLTWAQYDSAASPLGALHFGKTKSGVPRSVPVHATLAKILAAWKLSGWQETYGRKPKPEDMIVMTLAGKRRKPDEVQKQFKIDLETLGLRVKAGATRSRRGHDLRRTLISLARSDGTLDSVFRWITHGPKAGEILDVYTTFPWEALCAEMQKLQIRLLEGEVVQLQANGIRGAVLVQSTRMGATGGLERYKERPRRDSNPEKSSQGDATLVQLQEVSGRSDSEVVCDLHQTAPQRRGT